jgi:hypothetical protein
MIMREAATPHERIPATLRFLANGRSNEDLKYSTSTKVWAHRSHLYHCQNDEILQNYCRKQHPLVVDDADELCGLVVSSQPHI